MGVVGEEEGSLGVGQTRECPEQCGVRVLVIKDTKEHPRGFLNAPLSPNYDRNWACIF